MLIRSALALSGLTPEGENVVNYLIPLLGREPVRGHWKMQVRHEVVQIDGISIRLACDGHEARCLYGRGQDMTGAAATRLIRGDSVAFGAPVVGNRLPSVYVGLNDATSR
jgi:hypothetical protein